MNITKPIAPDTLIERIDELLAQGQAKVEATVQASIEALENQLLVAQQFGEAASGRIAELETEAEANNRQLQLCREALELIANWRKGSAEYTDRFDLPRRKMDESQVIHIENEARRCLASIEGVGE